MSQQQQWQQWHLEGNTPEAYERYMVPAFFATWAARLIEKSKLEAGESVLDVACGTGIVARTAAQYVGSGGRIVGLDLNPNMLAVARTAAAGIDPEIEWRAGNAAEIPFADGTFDLVFCQFRLQYFPDRPGALREMYRVLKQGGRLLVSIPRSIRFWPCSAILAEALERYVGPEVAAIMHAPYALGDAEKIRSLVTDAGFQDIHIEIVIETMRFPSPEEFVRRQVISSPLAGPVSQIDDDARANVILHVATALRPYVDDDGLVNPMEAHFVVAHK